jgi:hypothetical protein
VSADFIIFSLFFLQLTVAVKKGIDIILAETPVSSRTDTVGLQSALIAPAPHCINMQVEYASYLTRCQHGFDLTVPICHILSSPRDD